MICGYGEILKHSLIANKSFYKFLDKNSDRILNLHLHLLKELYTKAVK
jgi:3-dehydroquinate synthetase